MTIATLLQNAHLRKFRDVDYPEATSEDFLVRLRMADDGLNEWEKEALNGVAWPELKEDASIAATGTGTDPEPDDFLCFMPSDEKPAIITDGANEWSEISMQEGNRMIQDGITDAYVFWREAGNIRMLPAISASGTITFPYLRKITRYPLGTEADPIECDTKFLEEYVIAQMFLDDKNTNTYSVHLQVAKDVLDNRKYQVITQKPAESSFGFGQ